VDAAQAPLQMNLLAVAMSARAQREQFENPAPKPTIAANEIIANAWFRLFSTTFPLSQPPFHKPVKLSSPILRGRNHVVFES
jgi:hypothetical protein